MKASDIIDNLVRESKFVNVHSPEMWPFNAGTDDKRVIIIRGLAAMNSGQFSGVVGQASKGFQTLCFYFNDPSDAIAFKSQVMRRYHDLFVDLQDQDNSVYD